MAVGNASREMLNLARRERNEENQVLRQFQVLPLSLLILALVLTGGVAFFRSDIWLLGASFVAGGFLVVSSLMYLASKQPPSSDNAGRKNVNAKHLGTGTLSTIAGSIAILAVMGDFGVSAGEGMVFVAQLGFALVIAGGFWLVMTIRDML